MTNASKVLTVTQINRKFITPDGYIIVSEQGNTYLGFIAGKIMNECNSNTNYKFTNKFLIEVLIELKYKEVAE